MSGKAREVLAVSHLAAIDGPPDWDWDWAENLFHENRDAAHDGDCTKKPYTCTRCVIDEAVWFADQTLAALAAAGLAVVPVEPTEEMITAADAPEYHVTCERRFVRREIVREWHAMLAAAPKP